MREPVSKEEWRQYFEVRLKAAEQRANSARTEWEREQLHREVDQIRTKLALLDFNLDTWRWEREHANR